MRFSTRGSDKNVKLMWKSYVPKLTACECPWASSGLKPGPGLCIFPSRLLPILLLLLPLGVLACRIRYRPDFFGPQQPVSTPGFTIMAMRPILLDWSQNNFTKVDMDTWKTKDGRVMLLPAIGKPRRETSCFFYQRVHVCVCKDNLLCLGYITFEALSDFQAVMLALSSGDSWTREIYLLST